MPTRFTLNSGFFFFFLSFGIGRYDGFSSFLGEGKPFVGIANSYLQSGHTVLLALTLLCGFVELQGFPLTELPYDVREFLKVCLLIWLFLSHDIFFLFVISLCGVICTRLTLAESVVYGADLVAEICKG